MEKIFLMAILATALFCFAKFVEMKYLEEEVKPLKILIRDSAMVFAGAFLSGYIFLSADSSMTDFFNVITENKTVEPDTTQIFTDTPGF